MTPAALPRIVILRDRISAEELKRLVQETFTDMVKYVVDIRREVIALGGDLHADAEHILLEDGSRAQDLWGANYYPGRESDDCIEFTSLINIRPAMDNPGMEIIDEIIRGRVRSITHELIGKGEPLA